MIGNLITALGVACLSFQTPTTTKIDEPRPAYYDSSSIAEYGTTPQYFYNYSETTLYMDSSSQTLTENESCEYQVGGSGYQVWYIYNQSPTADQRNEFYETHDLYINGVLYEGSDYLADGNGPSGLYLNGSVFNRGYVWLFDHGQQTTMTEGIFDTIGDTITGFASVLGNGMESMVSVFWDGTNLTAVGILGLIAMGCGVVWFSLGIVFKLFDRKR